ncbi:DUF885 domain-containing protein [Actinomarinicola tropica]|uniref:DUF885 domain-containing protein n=1 Tax=Actinomarinicola tropica TaxID=2789776 RepID=UPI003898E922
MSPVYAIADRYIEEAAALNPIAATSWGVPGHDDRMPDLSPDGEAEVDELHDRTLAALRDAPEQSDRDRIAKAFMSERLELAREMFDAGEHLRSTRTLGSPLGSVRSAFDLMRYESDDDWATAARRMQAVPEAVEGWCTTQRRGAELGIVAAKRQVATVAQQAAVWSGTDGAGSRPFFHALVDRYEAIDGHSPGVLADLRAGADVASAAFADASRFLLDEYAAHATEQDAVGRERYQREARRFLGMTIDPIETYEWGWQELARIEARAAEVCDAISPGATWAEAVEILEADPAYVIEGVDDFQAWNQDLIDRTIAELDGTHFDIAPPIRRCEAMIAPPGGAAAMYYTGPSEDLSRPGRTWYPTLGKTRFPLWREVSICYHEGVPGHHLQIAQTKLLADELSRYQRAAGFVSGHGEGWALYAERLMGELGYLDDPAYELGMLAASAMRAVRVIVDIGMHLELTIPESSDYLPGATWRAENALPFVIERSRFPADFMASEVDRYLGLPGQAISYKVGERVWLECRADAQARHGADFDLKAWHARALDLGGLGLAALRDELSRV